MRLPKLSTLKVTESTDAELESDHTIFMQWQRDQVPREILIIIARDLEDRRVRKTSVHSEDAHQIARGN